MIRALISAALAALVLTGAAAQARPWTLADLGRIPREDLCLAAAGQTFRSLLGERRIGALYRTGWAIHADQLAGDHDAVITCTHGNARGARATLVIHSRGSQADAQFLARRISVLFDTQAERVVQAWRDSFD